MRTARVLLRGSLFLALFLGAGCDNAPSGSDAGGADAGPSGSDAGAIGPSTEPVIPASTGACPDLSASGAVTFAPAGIAPRDVRIWVGPEAASLDGPLYLYWHATGSQPLEAEYGIGPDQVEAILAAGGLVAAPFSDPAAGDFPWFLTTGNGTDDLVLADEIVACVAETVGVDRRRIHALGMSAGALHVSQMAFRRASYLASVVTYSGGLFLGRAPPSDDRNNRFAALMFHGGPTDRVVIQFDDATRALWEALDERDHLGVICDHGRGHSIPMDARADVATFFAAHPFGAWPSPWTSALPNGFYPACALAP